MLSKRWWSDGGRYINNADCPEECIYIFSFIFSCWTLISLFFTGSKRRYVKQLRSNFQSYFLFSLRVELDHLVLPLRSIIV